MSRKAKMVLQAGLAGLSLVAGGASLADVASDCTRSKVADVRIKACSEIIAAKSAQTSALALAYRNRASAYAERAAAKEAIADFTQAISLDGKDAAAFSGRAQAKMTQDDVDGAIADYGQAISLNPGVAALHVARGYAQLVKGKPDEAIADYSEAIRLDPKYAGAYNNRGLAQRKKGDLNRAVEDYSMAIEFNPAYALAYNNRGYAREAQGQKQAAIDDFSHALSLDPSLAGAREGLKRLDAAVALTAESDRLVSEGAALAQKNCAWCHAIGRTGDSPNPRAPRWRDLDKRHPILALREPLSRGIARPHDEMPKFDLSDKETDTIIAYINSLSH